MEIEKEYPFLLKYKIFKKRGVKILKIYFTDIHDAESEQFRSEPNLIANFHDNGYLKSYVFIDNEGKPIEASVFDLNGYKIRYKKSEDQSSVWESSYEIKYKYNGKLIVEKETLLKTSFYHLFQPGKIIKEKIKPHKKEIFKYNLNNEIVEIETIDLQDETPKTCYKKEYIYKNHRDYEVIEYKYSENYYNKLVRIAKTHNIFDESGNLTEEMILTNLDLIENNDNYYIHNVYKYRDDGNLIERFYYSYKELRDHDSYIYDNDLVIKIESDYNGKLYSIIKIEYES